MRPLFHAARATVDECLPDDAHWLALLRAEGECDAAAAGHLNKLRASTKESRLPQLSSPTSNVVTINVATSIKNHLAAEAGVPRGIQRLLKAAGAVCPIGRIAAREL